MLFVLVLLLTVLAPIGFAGLILWGRRVEATSAQRSWRPLAAEGVMAATTGIGTAAITLLLPILPYVIVPLAVTAVLCNRWLARRQWLPLGFYLIGAAGFWLSLEAWSAWNDLTDQAVSRPGWSPVPMVAAAAIGVLGATALLASSRRRAARSRRF